MDLNQEQNTKRYGVLDTSLLTYFSLPMLIFLGFVIFVVISGFETLVLNFQTNVALNGLIVGVGLYGISSVFWNNFLLMRTARYLKRVEAVSEKDEITDADIAALKNGLNGAGRLFNTSQMAESLENIQKFGHLNFTDKNAMLIKSKLGRRVGAIRSSVGFLSGILVMLGLLGTFWGLLKTIDAVGEAMGSIANLDMTSTDGEGGDAMGGFIASIAAPLQGMGLAFSSSLFGLSGSLLIGLFNFFAGSVQNNFIENISRWMDDRIPRFDPASKDKSAPKVPNQDDLRTWLMGFVYLANENNKKMGKLFLGISELASKSQDMISQSEQNKAHQAHLIDGLGGIQSTLGQMRDQNADLTARIVEKVGALEHIGQKIDGDSAKTIQIVDHAKQEMARLNDFAKMLGAQMETVTQALERQTKESNDHFRSLERAVGDQSAALLAKKPVAGSADETTAQIAQSLQELSGAVVKIHETQDGLQRSIHDLQAVVRSSQEQGKMSSMMVQLNHILEEMKQSVDKDVFQVLNEAPQVETPSDQNDPQV